MAREPKVGSTAALVLTRSTFGTSQTSVPGVVNLAGEIAERTLGNHEYRKAHATFGKPPGSSGNSAAIEPIAAQSL